MTVTIENLGLRPYREVWAYQKELQAKLIKGEIEDHLIICEHFPVLTAGKSAKNESLLVDSETLSQKGIEFIEIERGGDITYHGPGQIVAYPILDLKRYKTDVAWYMRQLEEVMIRTLNFYGISGVRVQGKTGVWIVDDCGERKIGALGVRISRWCTIHGLSLNVKDCSEGFSLIHPCGLVGAAVTSLEQEGVTIEADQLAKILSSRFLEVFNSPQTG